MRRYSTRTLLAAVFSFSLCVEVIAADTAPVKEVAIEGLDSVAIKVRMEGPYTAARRSN
jgi:hypothetical protein